MEVSAGLFQPGRSVLQAHQPAVGPAAFPLRPLEDGGIGLPLPVAAAGREGDQQIAGAGIDFGVFRSGGGCGPDGVGRQVRVDQDCPLLFLPRPRIEIGEGAEAFAVRPPGLLAPERLGAGPAAVAMGHRCHRR